MVPRSRVLEAVYPNVFLPFVNAAWWNCSAASAKEAGWQGIIGESEEAGCSSGMVC